MVLKAALLAPAGTIEAWGVQQLLSGDPVAGGVAMLIGVVFVAAFVALQEYDIPYEAEIVELIEQNPDAFSADNVEDLSKEVSDVSEKLEQNDYDLGKALAEARENQQDAHGDDGDSEV
jgi:hypothetical protein